MTSTASSGSSSSPPRARWTIQAFPLVTLLSAHGLEDLLARLRLAWSLTLRQVRLSGGSAVVAVSLLPASAFVPVAVRQACKTTRLLARDWAIKTVPEGATLVTEAGALPLVPRHWALEVQVQKTGDDASYETTVDGKTLRVRLVPTIRMRDALLDAHPGALGTYIVARVGAEGGGAAFFARLRADARLVARFEASWYRWGPDLEVYKLASEGPR
jgi:hypothetical protein